MRKLNIERVDNGFVVLVTNEGVSDFKARYDKPKLVFESLEDLLKWLGRELGKETEE